MITFLPFRAYNTDNQLIIDTGDVVILKVYILKVKALIV